MLRSYQKKWLRFDLVAGIVLAAILVPQGLAYAELAGVPPVTGLYTTIVCLIVYALMGPSRVLVLGPDSSVSPLIFAAIVPLMVADDPASAIALAGMLALLVGGIEIALGVGKLGFIADLLSKEVQVGYMNGLAITIIAGQLPKLFGFSTDADTFVQEVRAFFSSLDQTDVTTLVLGLVTLALLFGLPLLSRKVPAILVAVVVATVVTAALGLADKGVDTVGTLPEGLPVPSFPWTGWSDLATLTAAAVGIVLVSLTDTIATSSAFAARRGDEVNADREMIAVGASNVGAGLFQGFAISVSSSRTAVAERSGTKSQVAGLVGAGLVALMLVAVPGLLRDLPQTALAAVVIMAAVSLADVAVLRRFARVRKTALALSLVATVGVVFFGVLEGILIAAILSILLFFRRSWWPEGAVLGYVQDLKGWHSVERYAEAEQTEGVVIYRWEAPLFFANAGIFRQQIRKLVRERKPHWVVLQCEAVTDIDVTAADMLKGLDQELNAKGIHLAFVELRDRLQDRVETYGLLEELDHEHFFAKMKPALRDIAAHDPDSDDVPHRWRDALDDQDSDY
jgi:high affinity sulfate transporter 1